MLGCDPSRVDLDEPLFLVILNKVRMVRRAHLRVRLSGADPKVRPYGGLPAREDIFRTRSFQEFAGATPGLRPGRKSDAGRNISFPLTRALIATSLEQVNATDIPNL